MTNWEFRRVANAYPEYVCVKHAYCAGSVQHPVCPKCEAEKKAKENPFDDVNPGYLEANFKALQDQIERLRENVEKLKAVEPAPPDYCACQNLFGPFCPCCGKQKKKVGLTMFGHPYE